ncbi:hypothetical protein H0H87_012087 [Tephrocybe sp. NHM501043]|nr:hypothetical protein H0H87_012087 [Tephrocybe sp. NHM501043]
MQATEASQSPALGVPYRQIRAQTSKAICLFSFQIFTDDLNQAKLVLDDLDDRYRAGYSYKDMGQSHILALKMKHENFHQLLASACVTHGNQLSEEEKMRPVRVQWDPERTPALEPLPYRSIQIGISNRLSKKWVNEWVVNIEDVTARAMALKDALDTDKSLALEDLVVKGLVPREEVYEVSKELRQILKMKLE